MRNDSFSIKFYPLVDDRSKTGTFPIYVRIMINRQKAEITTKFKIDKIADWNYTTQRINKSRDPINSELSKMAGDLMNVYSKLKFTNGDVTCRELKDTYLGKKTDPKVLVDYLDNHLEKVKADPKLTESTVKIYQATIKHVIEFLECSRRKGINIEQVDEKFVKDFDNYLLAKTFGKHKKSTLQRNSVNKYQIKLKAIVKTAIDDGLIEKNPYKTIKFKEVSSRRTFLTKPELDLIEKHSLSNNESLIRVRDIFLFSVYTGLRFSDANNLREENIEFDGKKYWLLFKQEKTLEYTRLPMLKRAEEIYEKYHNERTITGFVLPRLTNQKVNAYLKNIAELAGIKKPLTHHVARHTNATTIFLANGVPLEVVSKQLGHSSIRATQIYAKITNDMLSKATDKLDKIYK